MQQNTHVAARLEAIDQAQREAALEEAQRRVDRARREGRVAFLTTELYRLLGDRP